MKIFPGALPALTILYFGCLTLSASAQDDVPECHLTNGQTVTLSGIINEAHPKSPDSYAGYTVDTDSPCDSTLVVNDPGTTARCQEGQRLTISGAAMDVSGSLFGEMETMGPTTSYTCR